MAKTKYIKYIVIALLVIFCIFLTWYIFVRENDEIAGYMNKFSNSTQVVQEDINNKPDVTLPPGNEENQSDIPDNTKQGEVEGQNPKPQSEQSEGSVILTSETEMLNKQGEELLKEISKELENSILTIKQSAGLVADDLLNNEQEL